LGPTSRDALFGSYAGSERHLFLGWVASNAGFSTSSPAEGREVVGQALVGVAAFLKARPDVVSVNYSGLESSPWHQLQLKNAPKGGGPVLAFEIAGGVDAGRAFVDALELHSLAANIGDVRSLAIHPATTTHSQLSEAEQATAGVSLGLVRLSVGIENVVDILNDLDKDFTAAAAVREGAATPTAATPANA